MIIYLHGFSSASASRKANYLKQRFNDIIFLTPDYPSHQPSVTIQFLQDYIEQQLTQHGQQKVMLIGSSLGGYYAQYLGAKHNSVDRVVLINPALQAYKLLEPYVGKHNNMVTGEAFEFTQSDCKKLTLFDLAITANHATTLVLLDKGDDIIDYCYAAQRYQDRGRVIVYPGGSHWFDHLDEAFPQILEFYHSMQS